MFEIRAALQQPLHRREREDNKDILSLSVYWMVRKDADDPASALRENIFKITFLHVFKYNPHGISNTKSLTQSESYSLHTDSFIYSYITLTIYKDIYKGSSFFIT